jgi:predicted nucleic acid-binding protein
MNGRKALVDSNIIIYLSKGELKVEDILADYDDFYVSIITYMEVLGFNFTDDEELTILKELLSYFEIVNMNMHMAEKVIHFRQKKKIKLPDAIILATADHLHCDLLTRDVDDFQGIAEDINIIDPFESKTPEESEESQDEID